MKRLIILAILDIISKILAVLSDTILPIARKLIPSHVEALMVDFMTNHRDIFVIFVVVPLSLVFDAFWFVRMWLINATRTAPQLHDQRVEVIRKQIEQWRADGHEQKLATSRPGWLAISPSYRLYKKNMKLIDVDMREILQLDIKNRTITVEPLVSMGQISAFLIHRGWTLEVLPEMDDLTVGGMLMGVGIETSSHKYGLFSDTCVEMTVLLPNGEHAVCSASENEDLFRALPWSQGTLGFLTSAKLRIVKCKPFVRLQYIPVHNKASAVEIIAKEAGKEHPADFVECLAFSPHDYVVMLGNFDNGNDNRDHRLPVNRIGRFYKPWFYKHVETFLEKGPATELIPLRDYYHRHTKSIFWNLENIVPSGNTPIMRYLFGWLLPPKVSFLKLTQTKRVQELYEQNQVFQDMLVPMSELSEGLSVFEDELNLYPLWICPHRLLDYSNVGQGMTGFLRPPTESLKPYDGDTSDTPYQMFVDLGAYGLPQIVKDGGRFPMAERMRNVEAYVRKVGGYQMNYAVTYMTSAEFREMFDHTLYDRVRKEREMIEEAFPQAYEKISKGK